MDSSWAPGLSQTNQQSSLSLKKNLRKNVLSQNSEEEKTNLEMTVQCSVFILKSFSTVRQEHFAILSI